jgi:hypothetical protein
MKLLIPLLIVSTSAFAVTTVQYAQRAGEQRKRAEEAAVVIQKHAARIQELERTTQALDAQLMEAQRMTPAVQAKPVEVAKATASVAPVRAIMGQFSQSRIDPVARGFAVASASNGALVPFSLRRPSSPAAQRYMKWQTRSMMARQYEDVGQALGLTQAESGKLIDLLADQMTRNATDTPKALGDRASMLKLAEENRARTNAEIANLIGESRMPAWQEYQASLPQRGQVNMVGEQFQTMGVPLTDYQRQQLLNVVMEDRSRDLHPVPTEGQTAEERIEASVKWQEEHDRQFLERARSIFTPEQYERYKDYQTYQSEMRNAFRNFAPVSLPSANATATDQIGNTVVLKSSIEGVSIAR